MTRVLGERLLNAARMDPRCTIDRREYVTEVEVRDAAGVEVFHAVILSNRTGELVRARED